MCVARISGGRIIASFIMALVRSPLLIKTYYHVNEQAHGGWSFLKPRSPDPLSRELSINWL